MFILVHLVWSTWHWNVQKVIYTLVNPINRQNIYIICRCSINATSKIVNYIIRLRYESFKISMLNGERTFFFLAESGIPAEYAFGQLMGILDPLQFDRFA